MAHRPSVFLSSVFVDDFDGLRSAVPLRSRIVENRRSLPVDLYAYEHNGTQIEAPDADTIIDWCFAGIKACDLFVFILSGRHGSGVTYFERRARASYLELELFAAAMLQKPILVLHELGREPDAALRTVLDMLGVRLRGGQYRTGDDTRLYLAFREACDAIVSRKRLSTVPMLADGLSLRRTNGDGVTDLRAPSLYFLGGREGPAGGAVDVDLAKRLLDDVARGTRNTQGSDRMLPHGAALFRIWAAMRQLMPSGETQSDPESAMLWDRALGLWAGKASWFGLHGHMLMAPYAALNSQTSLRQAFASVPAFNRQCDVREPLGARASALHSIAQKVRSWERKLFHFDQAIAAATEAMARDQGARQGILSVRGNALLRSGLLARPWRFWDASADLKASLDIRLASGAKESSVGEAQVDYGFSRILTGHLIGGTAEMTRGVALLRTDDSVNGLAFLARGLRKLEQGAVLTGRFGLARAARAERLDIAGRTEALDQARSV